MTSIASNESRETALASALELARKQRGHYAEQQQLSAEMVALLKQAGVYRMLAPRRFGGDEASPAEFLRLIERISIADGSVGWVASFGVSSIYLSSLPIETQEKMYASGPDVVFAGGIFPPQKAVAVEGGLEVSGRWSWGSGCTGAELIGVGISEEGGEKGSLPMIAVMPASKVQIVPNWEVNGLKGTGSHDMVVDKVVVPREWTFVRGGGSKLDGPLYRYPAMSIAAQVLAVVALGVARASLDFFAEMSGGRVSITGAPTLADRAYVQSDYAKAEADLRSARAFFYEVTEEAYERLKAGGELDIQARALLRLASTQAARVGADVAGAIYRLSGTTPIFTKHPIATYFQDAIIPAQHAFLSDGTWENAGKLLLNRPAMPGFA